MGYIMYLHTIYCCQDSLWLGLLNESRRAEKLAPVTPNSFEYVIDRFEKESFASSLVPKPSNSVENVGRRVTEPCAVCLDSESQQSNLLISCDSCSMTVHQVNNILLENMLVSSCHWCC